MGWSWHHCRLVWLLDYAFVLGPCGPCAVGDRYRWVGRSRADKLPAASLRLSLVHCLYEAREEGCPWDRDCVAIGGFSWSRPRRSSVVESQEKRVKSLTGEGVAIALWSAVACELSYWPLHYHLSRTPRVVSLGQRLRHRFQILPGP